MVTSHQDYILLHHKIFKEGISAAQQCFVFMQFFHIFYVYQITAALNIALIAILQL